MVLLEDQRALVVQEVQEVTHQALFQEVQELPIEVVEVEQEVFLKVQEMVEQVVLEL
jgi:hypothetical protein